MPKMSDPKNPTVGLVVPLPGNADTRPLDRLTPGHPEPSRYVWVERKVYDQLRADLDHANRHRQNPLTEELLKVERGANRRLIDRVATLEDALRRLFYMRLALGEKLEERLPDMSVEGASIHEEVYRALNPIQETYEEPGHG